MRLNSYHRQTKTNIQFSLWTRYLSFHIPIGKLIDAIYASIYVYVYYGTQFHSPV